MLIELLSDFLFYNLNEGSYEYPLQHFITKIQIINNLTLEECYIPMSNACS